jgi:hypothetical protein
MGCTVVIGSWNGESARDRDRDVDEQPDPVRDVVLQRPLQLNVQRIEQPVSVDPADLSVYSE